MVDDYYKRLLYTTAANNHKVIIELAFALAIDSKIESELNKVIVALHKSNAALTKLAQNKKISLRRDTPVNADRSPTYDQTKYAGRSQSRN
jgi:hypothetical protein